MHQSTTQLPSIDRVTTIPSSTSTTQLSHTVSATPHQPTIDRVTALASSTNSATPHLPTGLLVLDRVTALDSPMALLQQQQPTIANAHVKPALKTITTMLVLCDAIKDVKLICPPTPPSNNDVSASCPHDTNLATPHPPISSLVVDRVTTHDFPSQNISVSNVPTIR
jgi:hypothetical protein